MDPSNDLFLQSRLDDLRNAAKEASLIDGTNTALGAWGLASGLKEMVIEGGAVLARGGKIQRKYHKYTPYIWRRRSTLS